MLIHMTEMHTICIQSVLYANNDLQILKQKWNSHSDWFSVAALYLDQLSHQ